MTNFPMPLVSVIMPCYKQAHWLPQAIESVLNGNYPRVEIFIIDDGSPDNTSEVAQLYVERDPQRVRLIRQANAGVSAARNAALLQAQGEWVQLLDCDDYLHPDAIKLKVEAAQRAPEASIIGGSWLEVDANNVPLRRAAHSLVVDAPLIPQDSREAFLTLFNALYLGPPVRFLFKRDIVRKVGLFEPELHPCEDWDFTLRAAGHGCRFERAPASLAYYRNHANSASHHWERMWVKGSLAMHRAAQLYPHDATVQRAAQKGAQQWRSYCFVTLLRSALSAAEWPLETLSTAAQALRRDPQLAPLLSRAAVSRYARFLGSGSVAQPSPASAAKPKPQ